MDTWFTYPSQNGRWKLSPFERTPPPHPKVSAPAKAVLQLSPWAYYPDQYQSIHDCEIYLL